MVAVLGIPDQLADGPAALDDLAASSGAHPTSLYRVLRMLVGVGVFREESHRRFSLGPLGRTLCKEGPDSVRDWALYVGAAEPWNAWGRLGETVMTGQSGFMLAHSMSTYEYLVRHPDLGAPFDRWMTRQSDQHNVYRRGPWRFDFFLEYDRGTERSSHYAAKLATYYRYRASGAYKRDYQSFPSLLVVTTSDVAETRFAHQAYLAQQRYGGMPLSVFLTTAGRIQAHSETVLGAIWRGPGPGPQFDRLARVAWLPGRPVRTSAEAGG